MNNQDLLTPSFLPLFPVSVIYTENEGREGKEKRKKSLVFFLSILPYPKVGQRSCGQMDEIDTVDNSVQRLYGSDKKDGCTSCALPTGQF